MPAPIIAVQSFNVDGELIREIRKCLRRVDGGAGTKYSWRWLESNISASLVDGLGLKENNRVLQLGFIFTRAESVTETLHLKGQRIKKPAQICKFHFQEKTFFTANLFITSLKVALILTSSLLTVHKKIP